MIVIVDYGMGNLRSILYKLHKFNIEACVSDKPVDIEKADKLILPGVGHFSKGIENLRDTGLAEALDNAVLEKKTPILGICLGVQLFTKHSEEGDAEGLGWLDAYTRKFDFSGNKENLRVPHIGWNLVNIKKECKYWVDFPADKRFYFVHSYYLDCKDENDVVGTSQYGHEFVSIVNRDNIFGTQFHPEKSHRDGFEIIKHFANI